MKMLILGNRAIQHALAVRLENEGCCVHICPGQKSPLYTSISFEEAAKNDYDLVVLGSARYFDHPILKTFASRSVPIFGPDSNAAQLETSKAFFKAFSAAAGLRTPDACAFTEFDSAYKHIEKKHSPYVIKANGPARGCGVAICRTLEEAKADLEHKLVHKENPYYAGEVLIEEFVDGFEVAINVFLDGKDFCILPPTKPHKRRSDGDTGPMVAGMGSLAGVPLNRDFYSEFENQIVVPTLEEMNRRGWSFRGCLFMNLMLTGDRIYVLEYNCRMGDPAMLVDLLLMQSSLSGLLKATVRQQLGAYRLETSGAACAVTLCTKAYPDEDQPNSGKLDIDQIPFLLAGQDSGIVNAGTEFDAGAKQAKITNGVVFSALAKGADFEKAKENAYRLAALVPSLEKRNDIGQNLNIPQKFILV